MSFVFCFRIVFVVIVILNQGDFGIGAMDVDILDAQLSRPTPSSFKIEPEKKSSKRKTSSKPEPPLFTLQFQKFPRIRCIIAAYMRLHIDTQLNTNLNSQGNPVERIHCIRIKPPLNITKVQEQFEFASEKWRQNKIQKTEDYLYTRYRCIYRDQNSSLRCKKPIRFQSYNSRNSVPEFCKTHHKLDHTNLSNSKDFTWVE